MGADIIYFEKSEVGFLTKFLDWLRKSSLIFFFSSNLRGLQLSASYEAQLNHKEMICKSKSNPKESTSIFFCFANENKRTMQRDRIVSIWTLKIFEYNHLIIFCFELKYIGYIVVSGNLPIVNVCDLFEISISKLSMYWNRISWKVSQNVR